jgi:hypothetical protein
MRHFLSQFSYEGKNEDVIGEVDPLIVQRGRSTADD